MAFDSRYGFSQSDNTAVSTWSGRSGTTISATQSSASNQPTYQTNEIGGQPVISFDGANDTLIHTANNNANCVWMVVAKIRSLQSSFKGFAAAGPNNSDGTMILSRTNLSGGSGPWGTYVSGSFGVGSNTIPTNNVAYIFSMVDNGGSGGSFFLNGASDGSYVGNARGQSTKHIGGNLTDGQITASDIGNVTLMPDITTPLRKRLEHSAAYSFKIACN